MKKQKIKGVLVEPYPEIYKFGCDCASGREALKELKFQVGNIIYITHDLQSATFQVRNSGLFEIIEKDLEQLKQYKHIEKELGIDLITLFKALKNGVYIKDFSQNGKEYISFVKMQWCYGLKYWRTKHHNYNIKDYGITWSLTKEELGDE